MKPVHLQEDLKMEVISTVCEWPEAKVIELHQRKQLEFYVVRVIINHITNKSHQFGKKFRLHFDPIDGLESIDESDLADRETKEAMEDIAMDEIDRLYWYDAEMVRLYKRLGNYRAMQQETGIPFISCYKTVQKAFSIIKNRSIEKVKNPLFSKKELAFIQNNEAV